MNYIDTYHSPLGELMLVSDGQALTALLFEGQKYYDKYLCPETEKAELPVLTQTKIWLDIYFSGKEPSFMPQIKLFGSPFQLSVWELLRKIPYGETVTYGELAKILAAQKDVSRMSAQAVGGAVGRNPVGILVPCHRVLGVGGALGGYAAGIEKKRALLDLEK